MKFNVCNVSDIYISVVAVYDYINNSWKVPVYKCAQKPTTQIYYNYTHTLSKYKTNVNKYLQWKDHTFINL